MEIAQETWTTIKNQCGNILFRLNDTYFGEIDRRIMQGGSPTATIVTAKHEGNSPATLIMSGLPVSINWQVTVVYKDSTPDLVVPIASSGNEDLDIVILFMALQFIDLTGLSDCVWSEGTTLYLGNRPGQPVSESMKNVKSINIDSVLLDGELDPMAPDDNQAVADAYEEMKQQIGNVAFRYRSDDGFNQMERQFYETFVPFINVRYGMGDGISGGDVGRIVFQGTSLSSTINFTRIFKPGVPSNPSAATQVITPFEGRPDTAAANLASRFLLYGVDSWAEGCTTYFKLTPEYINTGAGISGGEIQRLVITRAFESTQPRFVLNGVDQYITIPAWAPIDDNSSYSINFYFRRDGIAPTGNNNFITDASGNSTSCYIPTATNLCYFRTLPANGTNNLFLNSEFVPVIGESYEYAVYNEKALPRTSIQIIPNNGISKTDNRPTQQIAPLTLIGGYLTNQKFDGIIAELRLVDVNNQENTRYYRMNDGTGSNIACYDYTGVNRLPQYDGTIENYVDDSQWVNTEMQNLEGGL